MEPQPPPGAPAPPPGEHARRSRKKFRLIVWTGVLCLLLAVFLSLPLVLRSKKNGPFAHTLGNTKQISLALQEFDKDYGAYPDADTIADLREATGTTLVLGTRTSNDYFRQLLAAGHGNEKMFHVPGKGVKSPDDIQGPRTLEKGECGFAYIPGLSSSSPTGTPVLIAPLFPGTDKADVSRAGGKVVALCVDGSAIELQVDKAGHVIIHGKRLLDPANPIWNGRRPTLVWPE